MSVIFLLHSATPHVGQHHLYNHAERAVEALQRRDHEELNRIAQKALKKGDWSVFESIKAQPGRTNVDDLGNGFKQFGAGEESWERLKKEVEQNKLHHKNHAERAVEAIQHEDYKELNRIAQKALRKGDWSVFEAIKKQHGWDANVDNLGEGFYEFGTGQKSWAKLKEAVDKNKR